MRAHHRSQGKDGYRMIKLTYCDDSILQRKAIDEWLKIYSAKNGITIEGVPFSTGTDLLTAVENGASFDIYILDIIMPELKGTEVAAKLREYDSAGQIIFLSSTSAFDEDAQSVKPVGYLLKPVSADQLYTMLDKAISELD